jgi:NADH-quinone oxidoreductase subunit N
VIAALLAQASTGSTGCSIGPGGSRVIGICTANNSLRIPVAYTSILPVLVLAIGSLVLLLVSAVLPKRTWPGLYASLTAVIGALGVAAAIWQWYDIGTSHAQLTIGQQVIYDRFSVFFMLLVSVATVLSALSSDSYLRQEGLDGVEAYVLMLLAGVGAMLMAASGGLIMLFLGLEIMSIALYVMAAYHRRRTQSGEAGFKYFILGSFSSAIFLYGIALIYGSTGSTQFVEIASFLARNTVPDNGVLLAGMALLIVGLGFKVAAVPFHFWAPDVYQGSPTPFTGYMAAVAKAAGFAGLLRVLMGALQTQEATWRPAIWLIAVITLLGGSVLAIAQKDLKRMLAYSSISQAGYVLVGVQAASNQGTAGALFYLFTYTFIIIGSFAVVALIEGRGEARTDLGAIRGLARRRPLLAVAMLVFLLAQAGVPFTSGFLAKFYFISASVQRGQYPLAIIAMLAAAVAAFFYLRVSLLMYSPDPTEDPNAPPVLGVGGPETDGALSAGLKPVPSLDGNGQTGVPMPAPAPVPAAAAVAAAAAVGASPLTAGSDPSLGVPQATPTSQATPTATTQATPAAEGATDATFEPAPEVPIRIPLPVGFVLALSVAFTIFAGVSSPVITLARQATMLF